jgi:phosphatidylserine/phosphatidylglycerophosphate/cardiolipin synthase-like enzyme
MCRRILPRTVPLEVHVQPEVGEAPILEVIQKAQRSIRVMVFQLGPSGVLDALHAKAKAGVKVRVILDGSRLSQRQQRPPHRAGWVRGALG